MTRDQAIARYYDALGDAADDIEKKRKLIGSTIDGLAALGLITLEEPKDAATRLDYILVGFLCSADRANVYAAMKRAHIKIVDAL